LCGICGFAGLEDERLLDDMCSVLHHRGPDDSGKFIDKGVGLGHRRLSIIDLAGGHQPVHNEDGTVWVVYNGEIYNFLQLKTCLESKGHRFYTSSDTEVLVHLYEEYGNRMVHHLRGMFSFALWDSNNKKLVLARDRLGIKPLYYSYLENKLIFASEIKALLRYDEIIPSVNVSALHDYLTFRHNLADETMFQGIFKLLPGHVLTYSDGKIFIEQYWDIPAPSNKKMSEGYYVDKLKDLLEESVRIRLMSEVPLGVYLSGGIDSGIITGMMSKMVDDPIETFSVGFGSEGEIGELSHAQEAADHFSTNHHEIIVEQGAYRNHLKDVIWHNDEPVADPSALAVFLLSKMASKHVTVVLNGAGGDEIFGGYISYKVGKLNEHYQRIMPGPIRRGIVSPVINSISPHLPSKFYVGMKSASHEITEHGFLFSKSVFSEEDKHELYTDSLNNRISHDSFEKATDILFNNSTANFGNKQKSLLSKMMYADTRAYLVDHILLETDKLTMSSSIEARVPIIDHNVVEFAYSIPDDLKLKGMTEKYILKKVGADILPKATQQRKKRPFRIPIDTWFKGELMEMAEQALDDSVIVKEGYFRPDALKDIIKRHNRSELLFNHKLYALLVFEMWSNTFIQKDDLL
jgi:asparagine synthase (glutamine-hydrolysing)